AARAVHLELTPEQRARLLRAYQELTVWPDVPAALQALRRSGIRLGFLSNMTAAMLSAGIKTAGLEGTFDHVLSTDPIRSYKPDPRAYRIGLDAFGLQREEILFAAFAGWDVAGARWFGYPTFWVNRLGAPREELGAAPDGMGEDLTALVTYVARRA
ncbi:MAG TPA: haloacid dehalogenase type II, partial [Armatimonadota bacterium]|nr:haloacid dehalogenase type II [Armatimonadota bacterium]